MTSHSASIFELNELSLTWKATDKLGPSDHTSVFEMKPVRLTTEPASRLYMFDRPIKLPSDAVKAPELFNCLLLPMNLPNTAEYVRPSAVDSIGEASSSKIKPRPSVSS